MKHGKAVPAAVLGAFLCVLAMVALLSPVVAQDGGGSEIRERKEEFLYILGPGEWGRLNLTMNTGGGFNYVLDSGGRPVEFHVYSEENGTIRDHIGPQRTGTECCSGSFTAPSDGVYVVYTERQQELEATVRLTLDGEFAIADRVGMEPAESVPGPAFVAWLLGTCGVLGLLHRLRSM